MMWWARKDEVRRLERRVRQLEQREQDGHGSWDRILANLGTVNPNSAFDTYREQMRQAATSQRRPWEDEA